MRLFQKRQLLQHLPSDKELMDNEPPKTHGADVNIVHDQDLQEGLGDVYLPFAPARKYPNAGFNDTEAKST